MICKFCSSAIHPILIKKIIIQSTHVICSMSSYVPSVPLATHVLCILEPHIHKFSQLFYLLVFMLLYIHTKKNKLKNKLLTSNTSLKIEAHSFLPYHNLC